MSDARPSQTHIAFGLSRLGAAMRADAWRKSDETGITPTQGQILSHLAARGPVRTGAIAAALQVSQPTASDAIAALSRKGLLTRRPDPHDARASQLRLTAKGRRVASEAAALPAELGQAIEALDAVEQATLLRSLTKMIRTLQQNGAIAPQRFCINCVHFRPYMHSDAAAPHHCAFVDAAFGDAALRLDCGDHVEAGEADQTERWSRFIEKPAERTDAPLAATNGAS